MRIILDECLPRALVADLIQEHRTVVTVPKAGLAGVKNGELLKAIDKSYDIFITVDKNLSHQQNVKVLSIAIIVLDVLNNQYETIQALLPLLINTITHMTPGSVTIIP